MVQESVRAEESPTSPWSAKAPSVTERVDEVGAWGRWWRPGGTGSAWMNQGSRADLSLAAELRRYSKFVERLIRLSGSREAEM